MLLWSNSRYPFFFHFRTQLVFLKYLAQFQSITNSITQVFWTFISENLPPPLIFLVPSLGSELEKTTSFSEKDHTGWNYNNNYQEVRIRITKALANKFAQFSTLIVIIISSLRYFWENDSFFPILNSDLEQGKLMGAVNSRKERFKRHEFYCS